MPSKKKPARKKIKPRSAKRLAHRARLRVIEVGPRGLYWSIKADGIHLGSLFYKKDALVIGEWIAKMSSLERGTSLRIKNRRGRHQEERTYLRTDDPPSPG